MAINRPANTQNTQNTQNTENAAPHDIKVTKVKDNNDGTYRINLTVNQVSITGCTYRVGVSGAFIAMPSYKGHDGKWYSICFVKFSADDIKNIEKQIEDML